MDLDVFGIHVQTCPHTLPTYSAPPYILHTRPPNGWPHSASFLLRLAGPPMRGSAATGPSSSSKKSIRSDVGQHPRNANREHPKTKLAQAAIRDQPVNQYISGMRAQDHTQDMKAELCCAELCCAELCFAVLCCDVLCCALLCCAVLRCAALCCAVLFYVAMWCTLLCCIGLYSCCSKCFYTFLKPAITLPSAF